MCGVTGIRHGHVRGCLCVRLVVHMPSRIKPVCHLQHVLGCQICVHLVHMPSRIQPVGHPQHLGFMSPDFSTGMYDSVRVKTQERVIVTPRLIMDY
jgi:hypothetical protein